MRLRPNAILLLVTLIGWAAPARAGGLELVATSPLPESVGVSPGTAIRLDFSGGLRPASVSSRSVRVFGRWSGVAQGELVLSGERCVTFLPSRPFFPGEQVTVSLSDGLFSPELGHLEGGRMLSFWVGSARGSGTFTPDAPVPTTLPGENIVRSYGIYAGDLDRDGAPDFSIPNEVAHDVRVMLNDGCGNFSPPQVHALAVGSKPSSNEGQDFDGDGVVDFVTANIDGDTISVLRGDGTGGYLPAVTLPSGDTPRGVAVLDVEGDGDVDVVIAHRGASNLALFRNDGIGTFAPPVIFEGGGDGETALAAVDANGDGRWDLFVGHYLSNAVTCLLGDGTGTFALADTQAVGARPWMTAAGDVDGDGRVDVATCNSAASTASVLRGDGLGGLDAAATLAVGSFSVAIDLGDLDGDGDLDLVASSFSSKNFTCYRNDGAGTFGSPFVLPAPEAGSCASIVDIDRDGFVDIVGIDELADVVLPWRQTRIALLGVQSGTCEATLRLDNLADQAGFGGRPPHDVAPGGRLFLGVGARPGGAYAVLLGTPRSPGLPSAPGLFNLDAPLQVLVVDATDATGESLRALTVPANAPPGLEVGLQVLTQAVVGKRLSNPAVVRITP